MCCCFSGTKGLMMQQDPSAKLLPGQSQLELCILDHEKTEVKRKTQGGCNQLSPTPCLLDSYCLCCHRSFMEKRTFVFTETPPQVMTCRRHCCYQSYEDQAKQEACMFPADSIRLLSSPWLLCMRLPVVDFHQTTNPDSCSVYYGFATSCCKSNWQGVVFLYSSWFGSWENIIFQDPSIAIERKSCAKPTYGFKLASWKSPKQVCWQFDDSTIVYSIGF